MKQRLMYTFLVIAAVLTATANVYAGEKTDNEPDYEKNKLSIIGEANLGPEIKKLNTLISESRWEELFDLVIDTNRSFQGKVIRVEKHRLVGVEDYMRGVLNSLPKEALGAYRVRFDGRAEALFNRAFLQKDLGTYREIAKEYFLSSFADDAMLAIAQEAMSRGDFRIAAETLEKILYEYPDPSVDMAVVKVSLADAYSKLGHVRKLEALAGNTTGNRNVLLAGKETGARKAVLEMVEKGAASSVAAGRKRDASWPMFGGSPSRDRLPDSNPMMGERIAALGMDGFKIEPPVLRGFSYGRTAYHPDRYEAYPFHPATDGETLFFATGLKIYSIDLETGKICRDPFEGSAVDNPEVNKEIIYSPTVAGGVVYGNFLGKPSGGEKHHFIDVTIKIPRRHLLGLDKKTGEPVFNPRNIESTYIDYEKVIFSSPPVIIGGRLYAVFISRRGYVDCHVMAFETDTGKVVWRRSISANAVETTAFGYHGREPVPPMITEKDGVLYVNTNQGALAAIEAEDGKLKWVAEYDQIPIKAPRNYTPQLRSLKWRPAPAIVWGDSVILAPTDSDSVYAFDKNNGKRIWEFDSSIFDVDMRHFLGVSDDKVVLAGQRLVALDAATGKLTWMSPSLIYIRPAGRGCLTRDAVYHPSADALLVFDLATGKLLRYETWQDPGDAGNVFIFGNRIVTTTKDGLSIFKGATQ